MGGVWQACPQHKDWLLSVGLWNAGRLRAPAFPHHLRPRTAPTARRNIKLGIIEDSANRSKLTKLLRYKTNKSGDKFISLEEYVDRMADWQTNIYFISGENQDVVEKSPFLEKINKKGVECLYLTDPIDEYTVQHITECCFYGP